MTEKIKLHFQRYEFKYHLPVRIADKIIPALLNHMEFDPYVKGDDNSYDVHSVYLDSHSFKNYHEKVEGQLFRKKLRIRSYDKNVKPNSPVFVEIKRKYNTVIIKDRITMKLKDASDLAMSVPRLSQFALDDKDVIEEFITDKVSYGMSPKVLISYKRKPLVGKSGTNLRVTFDYDISAGLTKCVDFSAPTRLIYPDKLVMEVKFNDILPQWLHDIIQQYSLETWPYSKYCFGIDNSYLAEACAGRNIMPWQTTDYL